MHTLFFVDTSSELQLQRDCLRDLILLPNTLKLMRQDSRGLKLSYEPRYNSAHFERLVTSSFSLSELLDFFWSTNWINTLYKYVSVAKQAYLEKKTITAFHRVKFESSYSPMTSASPYIQSPLAESSNNLKNSLPIYPNIQFSVINPGCGIPAHLDRQDKIASVLIYLPTVEQNNHPLLGTKFWISRSQEPFSPSGYSHDEYRFLNDAQEIELASVTNALTLPFTDSSAILFASNKKSWHSITYPSEVKLGPRVSININYYSIR